MRNAIRYYYNIYSDDIIKSKNNYRIIVDNNLYYLVKYEGNINMLSNIYDYLVKHNIYCHEIIINKDNSYITNIDNNNYILIKVYCVVSKINYTDILNYNILMDKGKCHWKELWMSKIDYYEYQMNQYRKKYPNLYKSFHYYCGMTESAIMLVDTVNNKLFDNYIEHNRIYKNITTTYFYNPLNMIIDVKVRDIAEYFKEQFFYVENPIISVNNYIDYIKLTNDEAILFIARLIYPSYYFDIYDEIVQDRFVDDKINTITNKVNEYEDFLSEIYEYIKLKYKIPEIEWLIKV